jgi:hypothetical protein
MVPLPDGTFMIMNGAHQGFAGFGLATDPNFDALLYDPKLPVGQRMSKLNSTTIARMYHSEAILLPDGRVMISGSDPLTNWDNGTVRYPEELRIEVSRMCIRRGKGTEMFHKGLYSPLFEPGFPSAGIQYY